MYNIELGNNIHYALKTNKVHYNYTILKSLIFHNIFWMAIQDSVANLNYLREAINLLKA